MDDVRRSVGRLPCSPALDCGYKRRPVHSDLVIGSRMCLHVKVACSEVFTESDDLGEAVTAPSKWCGIVLGVLSVGVCAEGHEPLHGSGSALVGRFV